MGHDLYTFAQDFVDSSQSPKMTSQQMKQYIDGMLKDLRRAHKVREEQLSQAAQSFKKRSEKAVSRHEELLVAYRSVIILRCYRGQHLYPFLALLCTLGTSVVNVL